MRPIHITISALLGAAGVILGAMGAHGSLHDQLLATGQLDHWNTATHYHLLHAVVLLVVAAHGLNGHRLVRIGWMCLVLGILLFSGSLYVLALTQISRLGIATPFGGVFLIAGWVLLAIAPMLKATRPPRA